MTSTANAGKNVGGAAEPDKAVAITWWAALGFSFLAFAAYMIISWIAAGDPQRVLPGDTPLPGWMMVCLEVQQWGLFLGMLALLWFKAFRPRLQTGSFTFDGLMVMTFSLMWWSDPFYNYFTPGFNYNAYFINLGSWVGHAPGWMSPNSTQIAQPLIWLPGVYTCAFFAMVLIVNWIFRKTRERWPSMSPVGMWLVAFFPMVVAGTIWEASFMVMGSHSYASTIRSFSLNPGHYYAFPIYQGITASLLYTTWGAMRFYRNDRGLSFAENGIERLNVSNHVKGWMRFFAVSGAITGIFFVFYHIPNAMIALRGDAWSEDVQSRSYFVTELCGPWSDVACPDPRIPFPRGEQSLYIGPDGRLVIPEGVSLPSVANDLKSGTLTREQ
ncbi:spirocyclase AveC family protein [Spongiibacter sp. KMU-166]|uniref:Spirocyclase AveC family protein n=1 Tax=Spongiibacter thalassae TaxID=2721624 RepID=A0ABX1GAV4_9GAMM|nr:spirocyclase AveC family protein [Spongiibacter thalassae]NKI16051.1 spirocyclase AveC family protein [Spongiibacter thalassae]